MRPHRRQPTRLPHPWDSPGKNTGVGCHFLLQSMKVKSESEVTPSCPTHRDPMDCSPPCSSIHGIFQARVLEWDAIAFSSKHLWTLVNSKKLYVNLYFVGVMHSWCFLSAFGCILSPYLFNLFAEYIMRNAGLDEAKLESRFLGEISITSDMQKTPPLWQKAKN